MEPLACPTSPPPAPLLGPGAVVPFPAEKADSPRCDLAALFESEESGLLRFAISLVRQRAVAEELVQETFLRLHRAAGEVTQPRAWLYRSLRNLALNHLRARRPEAELPPESLAAEGGLPAERLEHDEAVGLMRMLIAELPAEDRELVRLKYHEDLKYDEISRRTGLSAGNVGYRLHHALKALAAGLRRLGVEGTERRNG